MVIEGWCMSQKTSMREVLQSSSPRPVLSIRPCTRFATSVSKERQNVILMFWIIASDKGQWLCCLCFQVFHFMNSTI